MFRQKIGKGQGHLAVFLEPKMITEFSAKNLQKSIQVKDNFGMIWSLNTYKYSIVSIVEFFGNRQKG